MERVEVRQERVGGHGSVSLSGLDLPPAGGVVSMATGERTRLLFFLSTRPPRRCRKLSVFVCPATTQSRRFFLISGDLRQDQKGLLRRAERSGAQRSAWRIAFLIGGV